VKVLGIMGSPRIQGNTDLLLSRALEGALSQGAQIEKIVVDKLNITPCKEFYGCIKDGNCVIRDDMDSVYPKLIDADAIIIASPMFFYGISAQLKALIDRSQVIWARKYILKQQINKKGRKGAFIGVGATEGEQLFHGSILTMKYYFKTLDIEYYDELLVRGIDKRGEINEHPTALSDAFTLGQKLVHA
jgi:multimeric flavodoxin WrbA